LNATFGPATNGPTDTAATSKLPAIIVEKTNLRLWWAISRSRMTRPMHEADPVPTRWFRRLDID
jgi:hypothetical protein